MSDAFSSKVFEELNVSPQEALFPVSEGDAQSQQGDWRSKFPEFIGNSPKISKTLETVSKFAKSDGSVLIYGESGTGKELIASAIHRLSDRADQNFVALNCSAIPADLLESELFGHEKGAFTGADKKRHGKFEIANGGSIFLDEIGDMPLQLQAKLLRVIQEMEFTPVGSNVKKKINVRIIAATNIDLQEAISDTRFRLDLYYRLNVLPITLPPLRDRKSDTPLLLNFFLDQVNRKRADKYQCWFSADSMQFLSEYDWPGNIRQLQNVIERLVVFKVSGCIEIDDIPEDLKITPNNSNSKEQSTSFASERIASTPLGKAIYPANYSNSNHSQLPNEGLDLTKYVENIENNLILQALARTGNNKQRAAKLLGLNRTTLVERIKKRRITVHNDPQND